MLAARFATGSSPGLAMTTGQFSLPSIAPAFSFGTSPASTTEDLPLPDGPITPRNRTPCDFARTSRRRALTSQPVRFSRPKKKCSSSAGRPRDRDMGRPHDRRLTQWLLPRDPPHQAMKRSVIIEGFEELDPRGVDEEFQVRHVAAARPLSAGQQHGDHTKRLVVSSPVDRDQYLLLLPRGQAISPEEHNASLAVVKRLGELGLEVPARSQLPLVEIQDEPLAAKPLSQLFDGRTVLGVVQRNASKRFGPASDMTMLAQGNRMNSGLSLRRDNREDPSIPAGRPLIEYRRRAEMAPAITSAAQQERGGGRSITLTKRLQNRLGPNAGLLA